MILLFQINPSASGSALEVDHMRSFFECVLRDYYHHDVRTIRCAVASRPRSAAATLAASAAASCLAWCSASSCASSSFLLAPTSSSVSRGSVSRGKGK